MANVYFDRECIEVDDAALKDFCGRFTEITAGGGLVSNTRNEFLLIYRRGVWDLPKGKMEDGETVLQCALREVEEETGLSPLKAGEQLCVTHHTYKMAGISCLKHTVWFKMEYSGDTIPRPQEEEEIREAKWVPASDLSEYLKDTFPSIREVFSHAGLSL